MNLAPLQNSQQDSVWSIPLVRHLALVILLKLALLFTIWFVFFRHPSGAPEPGSDIHQHIAGPTAAALSQQKQ